MRHGSHRNMQLLQRPVIQLIYQRKAPGSNRPHNGELHHFARVVSSSGIPSSRPFDILLVWSAQTPPFLLQSDCLDLMDLQPISDAGENLLLNRYLSPTMGMYPRRTPPPFPEAFRIWRGSHAGRNTMGYFFTRRVTKPLSSQKWRGRYEWGNISSFESSDLRKKN
jgi:hypothetical protein